MAAGDFESEGNSTISASAPGVVATKVVTDAATDANSNIIIIPTSVASDAAKGAFQFHVTAGSGSFTVTADREQLPSDVTFNYESREGSA